jgi:hypothetical protein
VDPGGLVAEVGGIQAQDRAAAALSVWARARGLTATDVDHALVDRRSIVRTWVMRGTLHLVAAEDLPWLIALLGPVFVAATRRRYQQLGLGEATCAAAVTAIGEAVAARGPRTRAEIAHELPRRGIDVEPGGQALAHLVRRAALEGVVCGGPPAGSADTWVAVADWLGTRRAGSAGEPVKGRTALAELARRHLGAYGPARPEDLAAWSGLPVSRARDAWRLIGDELTEVGVCGRPAWVLSPTAAALADVGGPAPAVRLLPAFDTYLLGHRGRALIVDDRFARRVCPGGGWIRPTVVVDGRAVATWRLARRPWAAVVEPFTPFDPALVTPLEAEVGHLARFCGSEIGLALR